MAADFNGMRELEPSDKEAAGWREPESYHIMQLLLSNKNYLAHKIYRDYEENQ